MKDFNKILIMQYPQYKTLEIMGKLIADNFGLDLAQEYTGSMWHLAKDGVIEKHKALCEFSGPLINARKLDWLMETNLNCPKCKEILNLMREL